MSILIEVLELSGAVSIGYGIKSFWEWRKEKKAADPANQHTYPQNKDLICPLCAALNLYVWDEYGERSRNTKSHKGCAGCQTWPSPHIHVDCWACKFKFVMTKEDL